MSAYLSYLLKFDILKFFLSLLTYPFWLNLIDQKIGETRPETEKPQQVLGL
ncbi:hypothetical protein N480_14020 [Pseudoalteromonas luteoviolacea S2607]|nr:hypothetical protein N480_14020 [Pseudoalteromonas luteoviolacea S2607]